MTDENLSNIGSSDIVIGDQELVPKNKRKIEEPKSLVSKVVQRKRAKQIWKPVVEAENKPHARLW